MRNGKISDFSTHQNAFPIIFQSNANSCISSEIFIFLSKFIILRQINLKFYFSSYGFDFWFSSLSTETCLKLLKLDDFALDFFEPILLPYFQFDL